jgi:hypothetical protein
MRKKPIYSFPKLIFLGGMCSSSICSVSFNGSFVDSLVSFPLGALLVTIQLLSVRNELYGNVFEITVATLLSFVCAALASTRRVCYEAVASSSVVLILPVRTHLSLSLRTGAYKPLGLHSPKRLPRTCLPLPNSRLRPSLLRPHVQPLPRFRAGHRS